MTQKNKQGGCCGGEKNANQSQPIKEKDDCCDNSNKEKQQADKKGMPKTQGGCCG